MSWYVPPCVYPDGDSLCLLDLIDYFLSRVRETFSYYCFRYFLRSFLSLLVHLMLSQRSLRLSSFFLSFFFLYSVLQHWLPLFYPPCHLSILPVTLLIAIDCFKYVFISVCLFFSSFRSLLNVSYIFSIVFLISWIIVTIIVLNSFSRRLPNSILFSCFSAILSCPFIWKVTFCFFS